MKKVLTVALLLVCGIIFSQDMTNAYVNKSGKISYKLEIGGSNIEYTLIFDRYGKRQAFYSQKMVDGIMEETRTIITGTNIYIINYSEEQVLKMPVDAGEHAMDDMDAGGVNVSQIAKDIKAMQDLKKGKETFLGKSCDVFVNAEDEGGRGKYWIWNDYLIKAEFIDEKGEHSYIEASDIKLDIEDTAADFEIPSNFTVTDMGAMMDQMKQMQQMYGVPENE